MRSFAFVVGVHGLFARRRLSVELCGQRRRVDRRATKANGSNGVVSILRVSRDRLGDAIDECVVLNEF